MTKIVLFILAVFGLLASPVSAQVAQLDCGHMAESAASMKGKTDCCDKAGKTEKSKSCASNCAAMCGVIMSLETAATYHTPLLAMVALVFDYAPGTVASDPARFDDPPPRLTA